MAITRSVRELGGASWFSTSGVLGSSRGKLASDLAPSGQGDAEDRPWRPAGEALTSDGAHLTQLVVVATRPVGLCPAGRDLRVHVGASTGFSHCTAQTASPAPRSLKAKPWKRLPVWGRPAGASESPEPACCWSTVATACRRPPLVEVGLPQSGADAVDTAGRPPRKW